MVEAATGPCPAPAPGHPPGSWREQLEEWARQLLALFLQHSWVLAATVGPRVQGPGELSWLERAVSALDGTGLTGAERMDAAVLLVGHVRGITQQAHAAGGPTGDPEAQLGAILGDLAQSHGESYPALTAAFASAVESDGRDQAWEFGLQRILDGLAALIDRRAASPQP